MGTSTKPVWEINSTDKKEWFKKHKEPILIKKFKKFESSVTTNPYPSNPDVKPLKGKMKDLTEYVKGGSHSRAVRGVYKIDPSDHEIALVQFDWKQNIDYR